MAGALRTRGHHGVGLNEVLATADALKGVPYQYNGRQCGVGDGFHSCSGGLPSR